MKMACVIMLRRLLEKKEVEGLFGRKSEGKIAA
jgi:hypothetical protein